LLNTNLFEIYITSNNRIIFCWCVLRIIKEIYLNNTFMVSREAVLEYLPLVITWTSFVTSCLFTYQIKHTHSVYHPHTQQNNGRIQQKVITTLYYKNLILTVTGVCNKFCRTQRQKLDNSESGPISRNVPIYETVYNSLSYKYTHEDMNTVIISISKGSCTV